MSIKIYEAYRLKAGVRLDDWLIRITKQAEKAVYHRLKKLTDDLMQNPKKFKAIVREEKLSTKVYCPDKDGKVSVVAATDLLHALMGAQLQSSLKSEWDLRVWINIYTWKGRFYVIPYVSSCFLYGSLDFLAKDPDLEDYCYFNNTDRPPSIPARVWGARGKVWDAMDMDRVVLTRYFCDYDNGTWCRVNPWAVAFSKAIQFK